jgi:hypothetical protein
MDIYDDNELPAWAKTVHAIRASLLASAVTKTL